MMKFKVGDLIVHVSHGPGQIINLAEKQLFGEAQRLYYEVATPKNSIWVLADATATNTLRLVTPPAELGAYEKILKGKPEPLQKEYRLRQLALQTRLKVSTFKALCEVLRDLTAHGWQKPLSDVDAAMLRRLRENVSHEWALIRKISLAEANHQIDALLAEAKKNNLSKKI
jgi:RNA polymerase-interacting CarD/CdnL/TRCF family regulator